MRHSVSEQTQRPKFQRSGWRARGPPQLRRRLPWAGGPLRRGVRERRFFPSLVWAGPLALTYVNSTGVCVRLWTMRASLTPRVPAARPPSLRSLSDFTLAHSRLSLFGSRSPRPPLSISLHLSLFLSSAGLLFISPGLARSPSPLPPPHTPPPLLSVSLPFTTSLPPQPAP